MAKEERADGPNSAEDKRKRFYYEAMRVMETPKQGRSYRTTYYDQTRRERQLQADWQQQCITELCEHLERNTDDGIWAENQPLRGFPKSRGHNRTLIELLGDTKGEIDGVKRDGTPKDFARAPIDRWNKLFAGTEYEFVMVEGERPSNNYQDWFQ